jgi:two-component sensor histidine kinase
LRFRTHLVILVAGAMLPVVALVAFLCIGWVIQVREGLLASLDVKARTLAEGIDREIAMIERTLRAPLIFESLEQREGERLTRQFDLLAASAEWSGAITAFDAAGVPIASTSAPRPRAFPVRFFPSDRLLAGRSTASGLIEDGMGEPLLLMAVPAIHRGLFVGTIVAELQLNRVRASVDRRRSPGSAVSIVDDAGRTIVSAPVDPGDQQRASIAAEVTRFLAGFTMSTRLMTAEDGQSPTSLAMHRIDSAPWAVVVKIEDAEIRASMTPHLLTTLGLTAAAFATAIGLALILGHKLGRRISALAAFAGAIRSDGIPPRIPTGVREIDRVAAALADAAAQIEIRFSDREAGHARDMARAQQAAGFVSYTIQIPSRTIRYHGPFDTVFGVKPRSGHIVATWTDIAEIVHPGDLPRLEATLQRLERDGGTFDFSYRIIRPDNGEIRWLATRGDTAAKENGRTATISGVILDISAQKQAESRLRSSEARLRLAQQAARVGSWDLSRDQASLGWSPEQFALHETPPRSEPSVDLWLDAIHPDDRAVLRQALESDADEFEIEYRVFSLDGVRWLASRGRCIKDAGECSHCRLFGVTFDITDRKAAEERQILMTRELHHRVNNTLQTVQAIVASSMRTAADMESFRDGLAQRIGSLAKTHALLTGNSWSTISLVDILHAELDAYDNDGRIRLSGPAMRLPSQLAISVGMVIHELTTNAAKHGALSTQAGEVTIAWRLDRSGSSPVLVMDWAETNGPLVSQPTRRGFGSSLIERVVARQLHGEVARRFEPGGVTVAIRVPLPDGQSAPHATLRAAGRISVPA